MSLAEKIVEAKSAGYSDDEVVAFLARQDARVQQALDAGYSPQAVLGHLVNTPSYRPVPLDTDAVDVPTEKLNRRDRSVAEGFGFSVPEKAANRGQEAHLADSSRKALEAGIAGATDPAVRALLEAQRGDVAEAERHQPAARAVPRASQGDVRRAERAFEEEALPGVGTIEQRMAARAKLEAQVEELRVAAQRVKHAAARRNLAARGRVAPEEQAAVAGQIAELQARGAELQAQADRLGMGSTGRRIGEIVGGVLGGIGGAALGGWTGPGAIASGMAGSVAGTGLGSAIGGAIDASMATDTTREEAIKLIRDGVVTDMAWDAAGNLILFGGGKLLKLAGVTPAWLEGLRRNRILDKSDATTRQAVEGLERGSGMRVTPQQITEQPTVTDRALETISGGTYDTQRKALEDAATSMRDATLRSRDPRQAVVLGNTVVDTAEAYAKAVKDETRPAFEAARKAGVTVDLSDVVKKIEPLMEAERRVIGTKGAMSSGERAHIESILRELSGESGGTPATPGTILGPSGAVIGGRPAAPGTPNWLRDPEAVQDSISAWKRQSREVSADDKPSALYEKVVNTAVDAAQEAYRRALAGKDPGLARDLIAAQKKYRDMMGLVYGDTAIRDALRKDPEEIGRLIWQTGKVTRIDELKKLADAAEAQKAISPLQRDLLYRDVALGFLEESFTSIEKLARLEEMRRTPQFRRTFEAMAELSPATRALFDVDLAVLSRAARIAVQKTPTIAPSTVFRVTTPIAVAGVAGLAGASPTTGAAAIPIMMLMHAITVARTQQNKGVIAALHRLATAAPQTSPAAQQVVRETLIKLGPWLQENGIQLVQEEQ